MKNRTKLEEVAHVDISLIDDFEGHPFTVKDDESMGELARSIKENGILNPIIVRKKDDGRYEIIAGHRRKRACLLLGMKEIPVIVRELSREEAVIEMVDSNFQREYILPSERAKAYKMKMDSMKRKAGRPRKENVSPVGARVRTDEIIAREVGESRNQIQRYIRLNELTPELLEFVDEGKIGLRPAVEISFLTEDEQRDLVDFIDAEDVFPSHAQTMSNYLRELIHHTQPAEFPPLEYNEVLRELRRIGINMNHIALRSNTYGFADEREFRAEVDRLWRVVAEFSRSMSRGGIKFGSDKDMGIE